VLLNVMPPVQGDLDRRWGYKLFSNGLHAAPSVAKAYPMGLWNDDPATQRNIVVADSNGLLAFNETATLVSTVAAFAGVPRTVSSRGWLYAADGFVNKAWGGLSVGTLRNWGTDVNNSSAGSSGPNATGTATDVAQGGGNAWANPNNIKVQDGSFATITVPASPGDLLQATNFGFGLPPSALIQGIFVEVKGKRLGTAGGTATYTLLKGGTLVGTVNNGQGAVALPTSNGFISIGGPAALWGTGWTPADINAAGFGVSIDPGGTSNTYSIDFVRITVYYLSAAIVVGAFSGTGVTLISGRTYFATFYNSLVGVFSDLNSPSVSTGPVVNQSIPLSGIPVSNDPQIDRKKVLATADGGDQTTLYELTDLPNATTTFTDNIPEATLLLNNQWQAVLIDGTNVGVADNSPPPVGLQFPTAHRGRIYGLVGSNLYYSKSEDELITPTNAIAGRFEEEWPRLNFFPIASGPEQVRGLLSDGTVLYVGTDRHIIRLFGDGPNTFFQPQALWDNVGILNQDVWKLVLIEGNPIGAMWLTPDYRVLGSDFNTYQDVGVPVQNVLDSINVAAIQTAWAVNFNQSIFNLYVLAIPTGSNTQPDTLLVFDIKGKKWYTWQLTDKVVGGIWWVTLGGIPQFLFQATTGQFYVFDPTLFQDRVNDTPVNFLARARTSWLTLGDGTAYKHLNEMEVGTVDLTNGMTMTIEGASSIQDFNNPRVVVLNAPLVQKPRGTYGVFLAGASTRDRQYRFTFNFTDSQTDLLRSFNIQGKVINRI
jgi:hypothetical protein